MQKKGELSKLAKILIIISLIILLGVMIFFIFRGESNDLEYNEENIPGDFDNVYLDKGLRYGDALDYQCGNRDIDGTTFRYGECPLEGYDCVDNLCIAREGLSCNGVECDEGEYCSHGVCLLEVSGDTYFVALWGNDSWDGTFEKPF